jgi:DNA polymerase III epsilon subunit-like protein
LWPHIIEIAWDLVDLKDQDSLIRSDYLIKHDNLKIPASSTAVHNITNDMVFSQGISIKIALDEFREALLLADRVAGHNVKFDLDMVGVSWVRMNEENAIKDLMSKDIICTMQACTDICKIPSKIPNKFKWPKLADAYRSLFFAEPNNAHRAAGDVHTTKKILFKLMELGVLKNE